jgi:hypothetical protein
MIDGKRKNINVVNPLNKPFTPIGEFTIFDEPVVTVKESKIPADAAEKKKAKKIKIAT